ncbi:MAG: hypothetical protein HY822_09520 [Acidobacteria bacterium]|nr:hypothetical protein [Acidobacteriota bacterium]
MGSPLFDPWLLTRDLTQHLTVSALIVLADLVTGAALLRMLRRPLPAPLRAATALALGSGLNALILFWLGMAGWLTPYAPLAVTAVLGVAGAAAARRSVFHFLGAFKTRAALPWAALLTIPFLLHLADLATPVMEFDSTMYHMRAARHYRETQSLAYHGGIRFNAHPQLNVLLLLRQWSILGDDGAAKLVNLEHALLLLLVLVYAARELRKKNGWIPGALFLLSSPMLMWVSKIEYADLALAAYFGVAAALLFHSLRRGADLAVPAGLVLGLAASVKLQAHVLAACVGLGFGLASLLRGNGIRATARTLAILGLMAVVCCGGWWLRSWVATGSPAYPFFLPRHPDVAALLLNDAHLGLGRDWKAFLLLPWRMLVGPPGAFGDTFVFGAPGLLLLAAAAFHRRRPPPEVLFLIAAMGACLLLWFFKSQSMRYLMGVLPMGAILFLWLLPRRIPVLVTAVLALLALHATVQTSTCLRRGLLPAQRQQTLAAALPDYSVARELNRYASPADSTYLLFCEQCGYYVHSRTWGDWFGERGYSWLADGTRSADDVLKRLREAGFRWLLVSRDRARPSASVFGWDFANSAFLRPDLELPGARAIYSDRAFAVFQIAGPPVTPRPVESVLNRRLPAPRLSALIPDRTRAGEPFNVQPDRSAALAVTGENLFRGSLVRFQGELMETTAGPDHRALSAIIPRRLFERPGVYPVTVEHGDGTPSNILSLTVSAAP